MFKHGLLVDFMGAGQITVNGARNGPAQLSSAMPSDVSCEPNGLVNENFKTGGGCLHNRGHFPDDLRDLIHNDHGVFRNAVGPYSFSAKT